MMGAILLIAIALYVFSLFNLFTQIARYKYYWERNNEKVSVPAEILYVALGDSTAQGIGASHPEKGYVGIIREELTEQKNQPVRLVNLSKSGATIRQALDEQLPALEKLDLDGRSLVTIGIGANDMAKFEAAKFESEMDELMGRLPRQTVISDLPYFGAGRHKSKEANTREANIIMYKLAKKHGFALASLHERTQSNSSLRMFAADWFHPSNVSYRQNWAPVFLGKITETRNSRN